MRSAVATYSNSLSSSFQRRNVRDPVRALRGGPGMGRSWRREAIGEARLVKGSHDGRLHDSVDPIPGSGSSHGLRPHYWTHKRPTDMDGPDGTAGIAPATRFAMAAPTARCPGSGPGSWGFEGGRSVPLARPQCLTLRGLAYVPYLPPVRPANSSADAWKPAPSTSPYPYIEEPVLGRVNDGQSGDVPRVPATY